MYKIKRKLILECDRLEFYDKLIEELQIRNMPFKKEDLHSKKKVIQMNKYLQSDELYNRLRIILLNNPNIEFIKGNIFKEDDISKLGYYDSIYLSNCLDYVYQLEEFENSSNFELAMKVSDTIDSLNNHLNENGNIGFYIYSSSINSAMMGKTKFLSLLSNLEKIGNSTSATNIDSNEAILILTGPNTIKRHNKR